MLSVVEINNKAGKKNKNMRGRWRERNEILSLLSRAGGERNDQGKTAARGEYYIITIVYNVPSARREQVGGGGGLELGLQGGRSGRAAHQQPVM
jgi:hypothetical protein